MSGCVISDFYLFMAGSILVKLCSLKAFLSSDSHTIRVHLNICDRHKGVFLYGEVHVVKAKLCLKNCSTCVAYTGC